MLMNIEDDKVVQMNLSKRYRENDQKNLYLIFLVLSLFCTIDNNRR